LFAVDSANAFFLAFVSSRGAARAFVTPAEESDSSWATARSGSLDEPCPVAFFPLVVFAICLFRLARGRKTTRRTRRTNSEKTLA
jgi:hypothetical protein